jgi:hypothetical protein
MTAPPNRRPFVRALALAAATLLASATLAPLQALAQLQRPIPADAEVGRLVIGVFPEATLDGRAVRLGPGTRIFDEQNMIRQPSSVAGERKVAFARGTIGEITRVWLLSDTEFRELSAKIAAARRAAAQR